MINLTVNGVAVIFKCSVRLQKHLDATFHSLCSFFINTTASFCNPNRAMKTYTVRFTGDAMGEVTYVAWGHLFTFNNDKL